MAEETGGPEYKLHAIQLIGLKVMELSIAANPEIDDPDEQYMKDKSFLFSASHSEYDKDEHQLAVKVGVTIGDEDKKSPYVLKVSLIGLFKVDESRFPVMHLEHWARNNSPLVLYPFLREHVNGLTSRAGFPSALLPLLEIPTFRIIANTGELTTSRS